MKYKSRHFSGELNVDRGLYILIGNIDLNILPIYKIHCRAPVEKMPEGYVTSCLHKASGSEVVSWRGQQLHSEPPMSPLKTDEDGAGE